LGNFGPKSWKWTVWLLLGRLVTSAVLWVKAEKFFLLFVFVWLAMAAAHDILRCFRRSSEYSMTAVPLRKTRETPPGTRSDGSPSKLVI